jgi:beta-galactosidase
MQAKSNQVSLDRMGLKINGEYTILLCASLFYFRIPEGLWRDRMRKIRFAGYNCIDVYFPWNYHEIKKDTWLFFGQRDVDKFLTMAKEEGLYVVARPGPYICSEWDGGGLPAYLFVEEDIKIRDNDQRYLSYVSKWYDHILPIIAKHQVTRGGSVVLVQLENELDFFECEDRQGYMLALKQMADKHGIDVPCIACAGQGDLYGAWAQVEGIIPAMNLYLDSKLPDMEQELEYYYKQLQDMDVPLLVTETGREHFLLRRLLSSGAKLLGSYNQVAGTNFGFTNSVNNWGCPVAFLTSNYDFKSLVNSFGEISEEIYEARLLSGFIKSMGQSLAGAVRLFDNSDVVVESSGVLGYTAVPVLSLFQKESAGFTVPVTNIDDKPVDVAIINVGSRWPQKTKMTIPPHKSRFVLFNFALDNWGLPGMILFASAEPFLVVTENNTTIIIFHADYEGEVHFDFGENYHEVFTFVFRSDTEAREEVILSNGKRIV